MTAPDVAHAILGNLSAECPNSFCRAVSKLADCASHYADRSGLTIINCECRVCGQPWRRIEMADGGWND